MKHGLVKIPIEVRIFANAILDTLKKSLALSDRLKTMQWTIGSLKRRKGRFLMKKVWLMRILLKINISI